MSTESAPLSLLSIISLTSFFVVLLINKFSIAFDKISIQPIFGAGKHTSKSCDTELPTTDFAFLYSKVETCFINFKRKSLEINLSEI